jgi:hypothetical protein
MIFIPKERSGYYFINRVGNITYKINHNTVDDIHLIKSGNCYCTEEDARKARDRQYAKRELEVLADELNDGVEIDWDDNQQCKFAIIYVYFTKEFDCVEVDNVKSLGDEPICLDSNFLVYALQRIGIDKLHLILEVE